MAKVTVTYDWQKPDCHVIPNPQGVLQSGEAKRRLELFKWQLWLDNNFPDWTPTPLQSS